MVDQQKASTNAIVSLVLGIVAFVLGCGVFTAIPAWIIGAKELKAIDAGESPEAGRTMAKVGMILGMVGTVLGIIGLLFLIFGGGLAMLGIMGAATSAPSK